MLQGRKLLIISSDVQIYVDMSKAPTVEVKEQAEVLLPKGVTLSRRKESRLLVMSFLNTW